jgi:hypothetical protein
VLANNHPAVAECAGTIGIELLRAGSLDARVLPVSDGTSAAAGLAAIACHDLPGATLATGPTGTDPGSPLLAGALR